MGISSGKSSSTPQDMTPDAFKGLQQPFADVVAGLLGYGPSAQGGGAQPAPTPTPGPGGTPGLAGPGAGNQQPPMGLIDYTGSNQSGVGAQTVGQYLPQGVSGWNFANPNQTQQAGYTPQGNTNDPLRGIPGYQGPLTAGITGNEQSLLDQLMQQTGQGTGDAGAFLQALLGGQGMPGATQAPGAYTPGSTVDPRTMAQFTGDWQGAQQEAGYSADRLNPFLDAAIQAAQRPTQQALEETLSRTLPGRFTQAGQFVDPQGSSAFDRAAALATRGAGQTMGDIATNLSYQMYEGESGRQFEAQEAARQLEQQAMLQQLAQQFGAGQSDAERAQASAEADRQRQQEAAQRDADRQVAGRGQDIDAAKSLADITQQDFDRTIQNLQAQALPRLIEEMGIERGMQEFNNRMNNLMVLLQTAGGVTRPVVANQQNSSQMGMQLK